jgi:ribonuclease BN (tRNA processing enzyme)
VKITILGCRGEVEEQTTAHQKHSGVLIEDPLLFDIGEPEFLDLVEKELPKHPEIYITHLHPDHFYPTRTHDWSRTQKIQLPIYMPEIPEKLKGIATKVSKGKPITYVRTKVTPIPTTHSKKFKSTGYLVEKDGVKILYTGDMIWINKKWHNLIQNCDLVITDGSSFDKPIIRRDKRTGEIYGHNSVVNLVKLFKQLGAKTIVVTHFGKWFMDNPEEGVKKIQGIGAYVAFDGRTIELNTVKQEQYLPFVSFSDKYVKFKDMHQLEQFHMDNKPHRFVMQMHFRGKGAHIDHRWVRIPGGHILDGMTIAAMKPGITKKPVETVSQAKELAETPNLWKISNTPSVLRMFAEEKKPEPAEWLTYEGIVKPGEVGATKEEYGVFYIWDKGVQFLGAQKPYFKEFFLAGKKMTGRLIYRLIERRKPPGVKSAFLWLCAKPIDQTPYVLTRRAVKDEWVGPWNASCLPPELAKQTPKEFQFWLNKDIKKRLEIRNNLVTALKKKEVVLTYEGLKLETDTVPYVVQYKYYKKRTLIRVGPSEEQWFVRLQDKPDSCMTFLLDENPLLVELSPGKLIREDVSWMKKKGYIAPGQPGNPTPDTPAFIVEMTKGRAVIVQSSDSFFKLQFLSGNMKGLWIAKKELGGTLWILSRTELPQPKLSEEPFDY